MSAVAPFVATTAELRQIPLDRLHESPHNPRRRMDPKALEELAASISAQGVLSPLLVRPSTDGRLEIVSGHRRYRAARQLDLAAVPAVVRQMTEVEALEAQIVDNEHREDVHPLEQSEGYRALQEAGYTLGRIAERVGRSLAYVESRLSLRRLEPETRALFLAGTLNTHFAVHVAGLQSSAQREVVKACGVKWSEGGLLDEGHDDGRPVSIARLDRWVDDNVPLDLVDPGKSDFLPAVSAGVKRALKAGEKVVAITRLRSLPPHLATKSGQRARIAVQSQWRRADSQEESESCDVAVLGVIVLGAGRGQAFQICLDRLCDIHWGAAQRAAEARGMASSDVRAARAAWRKRAPGVFAKIARAILETKKPETIAAFVRDQIVAKLEPQALAEFTKAAPTGKDHRSVDALMRQAAIALAAATAFDPGRGPEELATIGKAFGLSRQP